MAPALMIEELRDLKHECVEAINEHMAVLESLNKWVNVEMGKPIDGIHPTTETPPRDSVIINDGTRLCYALTTRILWWTERHSKCLKLELGILTRFTEQHEAPST